ncbi:MAG: peroxiredoxin [Flavobacteriaceae bacterium]|nr:peroxiredoxin [Flavobacteriaceae bacterium]
MQLQKGDLFPDFSLTDQHGSVFRLKDWVGQKILVIYFYPKDYTPGCTKEACSFRDQYTVFQTADAEVIGVSDDSAEKHKKFAKTYQLPFRLLADEGGKLRKKIGIPTDLFGLIPGRATFVIDLEGYIAMSFKSMHATQHIRQAIKTIEQLQQK